MKIVLKKTLRECCCRYKALVIMALYFVVYMTVFFYLEQRNTSYYVIRFGIDAYIPFCEYFIVPYFLWFAYVFYYAHNLFNFGRWLWGSNSCTICTKHKTRQTRCPHKKTNHNCSQASKIIKNKGEFA